MAVEAGKSGAQRVGVIARANIDRRDRLMLFVFRLALGLVLYGIIIVIAAEIPVAAGLILTFPALNGLGLYFFRAEDVRPAAETMLLLPVINGMLCGSYILLYLGLGSQMSPRETTLLLLALVVTLWGASYLYAEFRKTRGKRTGIPEAAQWWYACGCTFLFAVVGATVAWAAGTYWDLRPPSAPACTVFRASEWISCAADRLAEKRWQVVLFGGVLVLFLAFATWKRLSTEARGFLGGLPLVPFGVLATLGWTDDTSRAVDVFRLMASSVFASPIVPIWFIVLFTGFLERVHARSLQLCGLIVLWVACVVAMYALSVPLLFVATRA